MAIYTSKDLSRAELQRRTADGRLQRGAAGLYSDDTAHTPEEVIAHEWRAILAKALPGAVITYANAFTGLPADGELNVSHTRRNPLQLPGLTIRPDMAGRREPDDIPIGDNIWMASPTRALIDNSTDHPGRPNQRITKATRGSCTTTSSNSPTPPDPTASTHHRAQCRPRSEAKATTGNGSPYSTTSPPS